MSSEPQHTTHELQQQDKFMVLASDGVWEFISSQEAVEIVGSFDTPEEGCRVVSHLCARSGPSRGPGQGQQWHPMWTAALLWGCSCISMGALHAWLLPAVAMPPAWRQGASA